MQKDPEALAKEICDWLSSHIERRECRGIAVAIGGELDSAVTGALARRVVGKTILSLVMPCRSSQQYVDGALRVVKHLGLPSKLIDLGPVYDGLLPIGEEGSKEETFSLRSRLRAIVLSCYAASHDYLTLGTLNGSDFQIDRYVKHADDFADLFPIIHLTETDVRRIAQHFGLPQDVIATSRSALADELLEHSESDFTYEQLDAYLSGQETTLPETVTMKIRSMRGISSLKRLPPEFSLLDSPIQNEPSSIDIQDAYDKSIEALTLISKAITSDQYLEDILRLIVMVTAGVMNSSVCSLWLRDEKENVLRLRATQSIDSEYLKDRVLKVGEGVVGKVVAENRPYVVNDVLLDPIFKEKELARRMRLVSMLSMPMRVKDRVIGVINCYTSHPHVFSDLQMNILTTVASQAAVAIENTELMVQTKVIQEELEKRKIIERAKDLLMRRLDLSGEEAYRWLQKRSMNTRKSMREISEAVLLAMEG